VQTLDSLLYDSTVDAMTSIGTNIQEALLKQLMAEGIECSQERVNLRALEAKLNQYFGSASPLIMEKIYDTFITRAAAAGFPIHVNNYRLDGMDKHKKREVLQRFVHGQPVKPSKRAFPIFWQEP
jgi:hypothetical protein